ncbi:hypothetical protein A3N54_20955 [Klebsiella aerogenes]|nr:hypothetical protein A3N54_20955 [Klebsiella aerogenes]
MPAGPGPIRADALASVLFCQHILQHGLVEAQIGNQLLQPEILFLELPRVFQLRRRNPALFLAPCIERGIGNALLTADLRHGRPQFSLLQDKTICSSVNRDFFIGTTSVQGV